MDYPQVFQAKRNKRMLFSAYFLIGFGAVIFTVLIIGPLQFADYFMLFPFFAVLTLIVLYCFYGLNRISYTIQKDELILSEQFFFKLCIPIHKIQKIEEVYTLLHSPHTSSCHALEIIYNSFYSALISPELQEEFIEALLKINPEIHVIHKD